jgi:hypothetical protein
MVEKPPPERNDKIGGEAVTVSDCATPQDNFKSLARRLINVTPEELRERQRKYEEQRREDR